MPKQTIRAKKTKPLKNKTIFIIALVCGLALLGFGTWKAVDYWQSQHNKYLVIKEWGVQFELPPELRGDIEYHMEHPEGAEWVSFTSKRLTKLEPKCGTGRDSGVALGRFTKPAHISYDSDGLEYNNDNPHYDEHNVLTNGIVLTTEKYDYMLSTRASYFHDLCHRNVANASDSVWREAKKVHEQLRYALASLRPVETE